MASLFYVSASLHWWEKAVHSKDGDAVCSIDGPTAHLIPPVRELWKPVFYIDHSVLYATVRSGGEHHFLSTCPTLLYSIRILELPSLIYSRSTFPYSCNSQQITCTNMLKKTKPFAVTAVYKNYGMVGRIAWIL